MRLSNFVALLALVTLLTGAASAEPKLYVNGSLVDTQSLVKDGMPHFPVDTLSSATRTAVESADEKGVKLAGSPVKFVPVYRDGRPFLPAEAFAMATGGKVERDDVRGLVLLETAAPAGGQNPAGRTQNNTVPASPGNGQPAPAPIPSTVEPPANLVVEPVLENLANRAALQGMTREMQEAFLLEELERQRWEARLHFLRQSQQLTRNIMNSSYISPVWP